MEPSDALLEPALLLYTVPLLLSVLFWLLSLVGLFDFDLDSDADLEVDAGGGVLHLLGLGLIPLSLLLTLLLFSFGTSGLLLHLLFGPDLTGSGWSPAGASLLFLPAAALVSFAAAAGTARLLHPLFRDYGKAHGAFDLIGLIGTVKSGTVDARFGTTLVKLNGTPVEIASRTEAETRTLQYGDPVVVIDYEPEKNIYLVAPFDEAR